MAQEHVCSRGKIDVTAAEGKSHLPSGTLRFPLAVFLRFRSDSNHLRDIKNKSINWFSIPLLSHPHLLTWRFIIVGKSRINIREAFRNLECVLGFVGTVIGSRSSDIIWKRQRGEMVFNTWDSNGRVERTLRTSTEFIPILEGGSFISSKIFEGLAAEIPIIELNGAVACFERPPFSVIEEAVMIFWDIEHKTA